MALKCVILTIVRGVRNRGGARAGVLDVYLLVGLDGHSGNVGWFDVSCGLICHFGNFFIGFVIYHEERWDGWKVLCRFAPLFGSEV